jgi:hypothetical protein
MAPLGGLFSTQRCHRVETGAGTEVETEAGDVGEVKTEVGEVPSGHD